MTAQSTSTKASSCSAHATTVAVDERACAQVLNISVAWLRKDRYTKRVVPFFRLGGRIRYDLERVRAALALIEEGGSQKGRA